VGRSEIEIEIEIGKKKGGVTFVGVEWSGAEVEEVGAVVVAEAAAPAKDVGGGEQLGLQEHTRWWFPWC
jgi:hypothetical protein